MADPSNYVVTVNSGVVGLSLPGVGGEVDAGAVVEMTPAQFDQISDAQMALLTVTQTPEQASIGALDDTFATDAEVTTEVMVKQDAATAATDDELAAAIAAIPTPDLSSKQDVATAATDAELAAAQAADDTRLDALEAAPAGEASPFTDAGVIISSDDTQASWVVGSDRMDRDAADGTKNKRAWFNKIKGAFRAGIADNDAWDDANVGNYSLATGQNTKASGIGAVASGYISAATGNNSHAEGYNAVASGTESHAEGKNTTASSSSAHAEGYGTTASGMYSHAEGLNTSALAAYTHAEGSATSASGAYAHAEGSATSASGQYSHAEGDGSASEGSRSHAEGQQSKAQRYGQYAKASGQFTVPGDAQMCNMVLRRITTDATAGLLLANTGALDRTANVLHITASRAYMLKISAVARRTDVQGEMAGWTWEGLVGRDSTGSARIIGTPTVAEWSDAAAAPWDVAVSIDTIDAQNNFVAVTATGEAGKTIRWVAKVEWVEVAG